MRRLGSVSPSSVTTMARVLVTGGAAPIGYLPGVAIVDNLSNSSAIVLGPRREFTAADVEFHMAMSGAVHRARTYEVVPRRQGDTTCTSADPSPAAGLLGPRAAFGLVDMGREHRHWQQRNPDGSA